MPVYTHPLSTPRVHYHNAFLSHLHFLAIFHTLCFVQGPSTFACLVLAPNEKTKENKLDSALMTFEALFHYYKTEQSL